MEVATSTAWVQCKIRYCARSRARPLSISEVAMAAPCLFKGSKWGTMPTVVATVLYRLHSTG
jgi:hypothetical protein